MRSLHVLAVACAVLLLSVPATAAPVAAEGTADADASVPCPDGSLGRLFCAIANAVNDYCEDEFGEPCLI